MKPVDVKSNINIDASKEINNEDSNFKIGNIVRISSYKNFCEKITLRIGLKKILWTFVINDLNGE